MRQDAAKINHNCRMRARAGIKTLWPLVFYFVRLVVKSFVLQ